MTTATPDTKPRLARAFPYILTVGGLIGLICSFIIMIDKLELLSNPTFRPNCDLNPIVSCGSVMASTQGSAFSFPNPIIGLAGFAALLTVGLAMLAGATFKRWFWIGLEVGLLFGVIFIHWLFFQSVYRIQALCPYCMAVWIVTITTFWYTTLYTIREGHIRPPRQLIGIADFGRRYHFEILVSWLIIIAALIVQHFWYYFGQNI